MSEEGEDEKIYLDNRRGRIEVSYDTNRIGLLVQEALRRSSKALIL